MFGQVPPTAHPGSAPGRPAACGVLTPGFGPGGCDETGRAVLLNRRPDSSDLHESAVCPHAVRAADRPHPVGRHGGGGGEAWVRQTDWVRRAAARLGVLTVVASIGFVTLGAAPAQAEVQNPRQTWLRNSTAGLFLHWGLRTDRGPGKTPFKNTDCKAWEDEVTSSGWSANYWADEALKLHAQYLVLASFHSRLGYARPWHSMIPGSCSTDRDILGET